MNNVYQQIAVVCNAKQPVSMDGLGQRHINASIPYTKWNTVSLYLYLLCASLQ